LATFRNLVQEFIQETATCSYGSYNIALTVAANCCDVMTAVLEIVTGGITIAA